MFRTLALALLLACAPKTSPLAGPWLDSSTNALTTISPKGVVTSIVDGDGEKFEIRSSVREGDAVTWVYYVPSTGYTVTIEARPLGDGVAITWFNDKGGSGQEVWTRPAP